MSNPIRKSARFVYLSLSAPVKLPLSLSSFLSLFFLSVSVSLTLLSLSQCPFDRALTPSAMISRIQCTARFFNPPTCLNGHPISIQRGVVESPFIEAPLPWRLFEFYRWRIFEMFINSVQVEYRFSIEERKSNRFKETESWITDVCMS